METSSPVKEETRFLVSTTEGYWGKGETLLEAVKEARALSPKTGRIKRGIWVHATKWELDETSILDRERIQHLKMSGVDIGDQKEGDKLEPYVSASGNHCGFGHLEKLEVDQKTDLKNF